MAKKNVKKKYDLWTITKVMFKIISAGFSLLFFLIFLMFFASTLALFGGVEEFKEGNIAVIPIRGPITVGDMQAFTAQGVKSTDIIDLITKAEDDEKIKAIILDINSPGGAPVASDEIARAVKETNKTTVSVIRETGASGAFWIATAADRVFANRMSMTGSIGVRGSYLEIAGLIQDFNVSYRRLVAGKYKDAGTPYKEMTPEEQALFQQLLDDLHEEFITAVAENRNMPEEQVRDAADGFVMLGSKAHELGFIDELGGTEEALNYLEQQLNITAETIEYKKAKTLQDLLGQVTAEQFYNIGKGIGSNMNTEARPTFS